MDESETRYFRRWSVRLRTGATEITAVGVIQTEEKEAILNTLVNVQKTALQILGGLIQFPINSYNQRIQQMLNSQLNGALSGKFKVAEATIGANSQLPCASASSLVLGGTIIL